jgi:hypothetical protein
MRLLAELLRRAPCVPLLQEDRDEFLSAMSPVPSQEEVHDIVSETNFVPTDIYQAGMAHAFNLCGQDCHEEDTGRSLRYFDYAQELEERPKAKTPVQLRREGKCDTCGSKPYGPSCPLKCDDY